MKLKIILVIAALAIGAGIGYYIGYDIGYEKSTKPPAASQPDETVDNYAECLQTPGAVIQESYPEVCRTPDGKSFTNPDQTTPVP